MKELEIEKFLGDKKLFEKILKSIDVIQIDEDLFFLINKIADLIQSKYEYIDLISFKCLVNYIVDIIEKINNNKTLNINNEKITLKKFFVDFYKEFDSFIKINVYLLGKDKFNIMNSKYSNIEIKNISNISEIKRIHSKSKKKNYNILFIENKDIIKGRNIQNLIDRVYVYEDVNNILFNMCKFIFKYNYDYSFLKNEFEKSKKEDITTLIVGSSYPLLGIDKLLLKEPSLKLTMHSQDLYYSYKLAKESISINKNIKRCIIGLGYYFTYHDLSKCKSIYSKHRIQNIYVPILNDGHNSKDIEKSTNLRLRDFVNDEILSYIFNLDKIQEYMSKKVYENYKTYVNNEISRESLSELKGRKLNDMNYEEKFLLGKKRASFHNEMIKFTKTNKEYIKILEKFLNFLKLNNVKPIIIIFPKTSYYKENLDIEFYNTTYNVIKKMKSMFDFQFIDFNDGFDFNDEDFIDMDHLGQKGCVKLTKYLNEYIF